MRPDGTLGTGQIFAELASMDEGWTDGMQVDSNGNVYCIGLGGILVFAQHGHFLGRIIPPEKPANPAWGDLNWKTLYITACTSLCQARVKCSGHSYSSRAPVGGITSGASMSLFVICVWRVARQSRQSPSVPPTNSPGPDSKATRYLQPAIRLQSGRGAKFAVG